MGKVVRTRAVNSIEHIRLPFTVVNNVSIDVAPNNQMILPFGNGLQFMLRLVETPQYANSYSRRWCRLGRSFTRFPPATIDIKLVTHHHLLHRAHAESQAIDRASPGCAIRHVPPVRKLTLSAEWQSPTAAVFHPSRMTLSPELSNNGFVVASQRNRLDSATI